MAGEQENDPAAELDAPLAEGEKGPRQRRKRGRPFSENPSEAATRQRAYRAAGALIEHMPPMPPDLKPHQLRKVVFDTGVLITQALTWATGEGVGNSQAAVALTLAGKVISKVHSVLGTLPAFAGPTTEPDCDRCAALWPKAASDSPFGNLALNAWRCAHLAQYMLPKEKGGRGFHMSARDFVYALNNCVDEAARATEDLQGEGGLTPEQIWLHVHRHQISGLMDRLAIAAGSLKDGRALALTRAAAGSPTTARPLSRRELADLGV